jgi:hypothetical protein
MSVRQPEAGFKPVAPPRTHIESSPAVQAFDALVRATTARDYRAATAARKLLRCHGWAVAPCSSKGVDDGRRD